MSLNWTFFLTVLAFKMFEEEEAKKKSLLEPQGQLVNAGLKPNRISPNWLLLFSSFASSSDLNYALAAQDLSKRMGLRFPMPLRNEALKQSDFHMIDCSIWYKLHTQWCRSSVLQTYHYSELFNWAEKGEFISSGAVKARKPRNQKVFSLLEFLKSDTDLASWIWI